MNSDMVESNSSNLNINDFFENTVTNNTVTPYSSKYGSVDALIKQNKSKHKQI